MIYSTWFLVAFYAVGISGVLLGVGHLWFEWREGRAADRWIAEVERERREARG